MDDESFIFHTAIQSLVTTIPCRPTAPDIQVNLTPENTDEDVSKFSIVK